VACNLQTRNNKMKLLTEYENVIQKVLIPLESILQSAKQLQHARLSWHVRSPSGIHFVGMEVKAVMNNPPNSRLWYT
jgi:hypothetical protein